MLSTPAGRRFYWRLLDQVAGVFSGTFTGSSQTFYAEGRRSVGIDLMREGQRVAPELYVRTLTEQLEAQRLERDHTQHSDALAEGDEDA